MKLLLKRTVNAVVHAHNTNLFGRQFHSRLYSKMKILNVAEKNDAAKNIAGLLSRGTSIRREGLSPYNKIYEFDFQIFNQNCRMVMTSVSGHLLAYDFPSLYRAWQSCDPVTLFDAPVIKQCPDNYEKIKKTLERETRGSSKLIIWTDCDREGENIGFEIIKVCQAVTPGLDVLRAQFSEITSQSVLRAVRNLKNPDKRASDAVDVRMELDLRIGAAFTRFQTLHLKQKFPVALINNLISYGSCQFPTLGFVVERYNAIRDFVSEPFWRLKVLDSRDGLTVEFIWKRGRSFNELACKVLLETCLESPVARVENVSSKPKTKWRPKPLDTVEMEKLVSRKLRINAKETMKIAEKLYTQGFISYPRTETNIFPKEMNLTTLVELQVNDSAWGAFAQRVLNDGVNPNQGNKSDQAHPPIHPTKAAPQLTGQEKRLYEFIVRHFLACVSKNAEGLETTVDIDIAREKFTAKGLMIIAKNYLEVYPYDKWAAKEIHVYQMNDTFNPNIEMVGGETSAPDLLTEADLIALMDKHGIGTDATHADHIETIKSRAYVGLREERYFIPKTLGMGLVQGYDDMGFEMSKPRLRAELENDLKWQVKRGCSICEGTKRPEDVLQDQITKYREIFVMAQQQVLTLEAALQAHLGEQPVAAGITTSSTGASSQPVRVAPCPRCTSFLVLKQRRGSDSGGFMISCAAFPGCKEAIWLPSSVLSISVCQDACPTCGPGYMMLTVKFEPGSTFLPTTYKGCIGGCDSILLDVLRGPPQFGRGTNQQQQSNQIPSTQAPRNQAGINANRRTNGGQSSNADVNCNCGRPAVKLVVRKAGPNQGKEFYKCDAPMGATGCDFFQWADLRPNNGGTGFGPGPGPGPGPGSGPDPGPGGGRGGNNVTDSATNRDDNGSCHCGRLAARLLVKKDGKNKGRSFFCCDKPINDSSKCDFFQWCDDSGGGAAYPPPTATRGRGRGHSGRNRRQPDDQTPRRRKCGLCGEEGHTKKNCPLQR